MLRIVKLGGSLLTWDRFPSALTMWLREQQGLSVIVVGGGPWVELLRQAADRFALSDGASHWLAIQAMQGTTRLVAEILREDRSTSSMILTQRHEIDEFRVCHHESNFVLFDPHDWLRAETNKSDSLPESWTVTSDSIAAHLARQVRADELVLLKSTSASEAGVSEWVERGIVDDEFPRSVGSLHCRLVNLRRWEHQ